METTQIAPSILKPNDRVPAQAGALSLVWERFARAGHRPIALPRRPAGFKYTSADRCLRMQVSAAFVVQSVKQDPVGLPVGKET